MHAEVAVVGGTVQTEVDAERDRRPSRVLGAAIKAYLKSSESVGRSEAHGGDQEKGGRTLFAGLAFNFSKIFWDCALVALMVEDERSTS